MSEKHEVMIHLPKIPAEQAVREFCTERCRALADSFPEATKIELSLLQDGDGFSAHAHVNGRKTHLSAKGDWAREPGLAVDHALAKLETRLRKHHDKMRLGGRRDQSRRDIV